MLKNKNIVFPAVALLVYGFLFLISRNNGYFWDNIQQISKEAHWFYETGFRSLLMPAANSGSEIVATGYHPPLMGFMTALLWTILGYKLWVSHAFALLWAILLVYNVWKFLLHFFDHKTIGWVFLIVLLEPSVLTQFTDASPDFILFTAFVIALRAILERKSLLLSIALIFLCGVNMRGIFAAVILLTGNIYIVLADKKTKITVNSILKALLPYLPVVVLLSAYFTFYLSRRGWFFAHETPTDHYAMPTSLGRIAKHLAEFGLRTIENGRFFIWFIALFLGYKMLKMKQNTDYRIKTVLLVWLLLTGLYVIFVFISQMPFSGRYFMPQFFLLTVLVMFFGRQYFAGKSLKIIFILALVFELTGNCWIYPESIAKSWDGTLAHLFYFKARKECFDYIDREKLNYHDISAGFCLYGDRRFVELTHAGEAVDNDPGKKYFIYSNISNLDDSFVASLSDTTNWLPLQTFKNGCIHITLYENRHPSK